MTNDTPSPSPAPRSGIAATLRRPLYALGLLALVWLVFGQLVPRLMFAPGKPPPHAARLHDDAQLDALASRVDALEAKLLQYESVPPPAPAAPETLTYETSGDDRLAQLEASMAALQSRLEQSESEASRKLTVITLFSHLREKALRGDAFDGDLAALTRQLRGDEAAEAIAQKLEPFAQSGIIPESGALDYFQALIPRALNRPSGSRVVDNVRSLVVVRKVGEQQGSGDEAVVARMEVRLQEGDMEAALAESARLSPGARAALAEWIDAVEASKTARALMAELQLALTAPAAPGGE